MDPGLQRKTALTVAGLALLLLSPPTATAEEPATLTGTLATDRPVLIDGTLNHTCVSCTPAVLHVKSAEIQPTAQLEADAITVGISMRQGYTANATRPTSMESIYTRQDRDTHPFANATLHFEPLQPEPQLLAIGNTSPVHIQTEAAGAVEYRTIRNATIASVEEHKNNTRTDGARYHGFWYTLEGPWTAQEGADQAMLHGNFTLFVNNVTIHVTESDRGTWTNWTGYKTWDPETPAGPAPNPAIKEYESRVTVIHVTNGTLRLAAQDAIDLYSSSMDPHVQGTITTELATGELTTASQLFHYNDVPLRLEGNGTLHLDPDPSRANALLLALQGHFSVQPTPGLQTTQATTPTPSMLPPWLWGVSTGLALPLLAAAAVGLRRRLRSQGPGPEEPEPDPEPELEPDPRSFDERLDTAHHHRASFQLRQAREELKALARDCPSSPSAWFYLSQVLTDLGRHDEALQAIDRFLPLVENDPEALAMKIRAHLLADDDEGAAQALAELSHHDPVQACNMLGANTTISPLAWRACEELHPDLLDLWLDHLWQQQQITDARRVFKLLLEREPTTAARYITNDTYQALWLLDLSELDTDRLLDLVDLAWKHDRLHFAQNTFAQLLRRDPQRALELTRDPFYAPLLDDPRIERLLSRLDTDDPRA